MPTNFEKNHSPDRLDKVKLVLMWALTLFMLGSGLAFMPSFASAGMILFAFISAPVTQIQSFWQAKGVSGWIKAVLLAVLFVVCIGLYSML